MKLLVTGGAGFIGSNFLHLVSRERSDWDVVILDALTYAGNLENLRLLEENAKFSFVKGDIRDGGFVTELFKNERFDMVVNFAAESHVDRSILEPSAFLTTNILGTQILLEAARKYEVQRFLQISTDEVYGSLGAEGVFHETDPLLPNSPYASSKASADLLCRAYEKTFGYAVLITRSSNNYGPYQFPEKLIPLMINNALNDKPLPVYGDGTNVRDWIHTEDNCRGLLTVLEKGKSGRIYNIGGGNEKQNIIIIKKLLQLLDKPESLITFVKDRPGHDKRYALSIDRAQSELGWEPMIDFDSGLEMTVKWYLDNRQWCDSITSGVYQQYYQQNYGGR